MFQVFDATGVYGAAKARGSSDEWRVISHILIPRCHQMWGLWWIWDIYRVYMQRVLFCWSLAMLRGEGVAVSSILRPFVKDMSLSEVPNHKEISTQYNTISSAIPQHIWTIASHQALKRWFWHVTSTSYIFILYFYKTNIGSKRDSFRAFAEAPQVHGYYALLQRHSLSSQSALHFIVWFFDPHEDIMFASIFNVKQR